MMGQPSCLGLGFALSFPMASCALLLASSSPFQPSLQGTRPLLGVRERSCHLGTYLRGGLCLLLGRSCGQFTSVSNRYARMHEYTHTLCVPFPCISVYTVNTEILFPFLTNFVHRQKVQFCSSLG